MAITILSSIAYRYREMTHLCDPFGVEKLALGLCKEFRRPRPKNQLFLSLLRDSKLLHQLVEGGPADAQFYGRGRDLSAMAPQRLADHLAFQLFARLFQ